MGVCVCLHTAFLCPCTYCMLYMQPLFLFPWANSSRISYSTFIQAANSSWNVTTRTQWTYYLNLNLNLKPNSGLRHTETQTHNPTVFEYFIKKQKWQPHGGDRGKVRGSPKSVDFILWASWMSALNLTAIHPVVVEIFQSGPKRRTNRPWLKMSPCCVTSITPPK